jgi:hypothetical protein
MWRGNCTRFWWESPNERGLLEDQGVDGRMLSDWTLGRLVVSQIIFLRFRNNLSYRLTVSFAPCELHLPHLILLDLTTFVKQDAGRRVWNSLLCTFYSLRGLLPVSVTKYSHHLPVLKHLLRMFFP